MGGGDLEMIWDRGKMNCSGAQREEEETGRVWRGRRGAEWQVENVECLGIRGVERGRGP